MAVIQSIEEFRFYETAGVLNMISTRLQAIEATINEELNRAGPTLVSPRLCIAPSGGSDGRMTPMGVQALQAANRVLMARALADGSTETRRRRSSTMTFVQDRATEDGRPSLRG